MLSLSQDWWLLLFHLQKNMVNSHFLRTCIVFFLLHPGTNVQNVDGGRTALIPGHLGMVWFVNEVAGVENQMGGPPKIGGKPPKSSILIGFSIINNQFWGTPIFGNTQILNLEFHFLAGPTRREWGSLNLYIGILGMKLPSFRTKGQLDFHSPNSNGKLVGNSVVWKSDLEFGDTVTRFFTLEKHKQPQISSKSEELRLVWGRNSGNFKNLASHLKVNQESFLICLICFCYVLISKYFCYDHQS